MYLTKSERGTAVSAYGFKNLVEDDHYQVDYDVWVYLFHDENNKKYVLVMECNYEKDEINDEDLLLKLVTTKDDGTTVTLPSSSITDESITAALAEVEKRLEEIQKTDLYIQSSCKTTSSYLEFCSLNDSENSNR